MCQACLPRRAVLLGLAGTAVAGCATNPVTGESQFIIVDDQQIALQSRQAWQQIKQNERESRSSAANRRVDQVADRVISGAGLNRSEWEVEVFQDDAVNAFALPGGKIGVYTGLLDVAETDAQLATVIGHEVAHVTARHSAERVSRALATDLGGQVGGALLGSILGIDPRASAELVTQVGQVGLTLPFGRYQESQADAIGLRYMAQAGYDPRAAIDLWQNMARAGGGGPPEFLSTHPSPDSRIRDIRAMLPEVMPIYARNA